MAARQTYLLIDLLSVFVPFVASFHQKSRFYRKWPALFCAISATVLGYGLWDLWFTHLGVWGFNKSYTVGLNIGNLPVEEVLFFICIPYACVFTFHHFSTLFQTEKFTPGLAILNYFFIGVCFVIAAIYHDRYYTVATFTLLAILLLLANFTKPVWMFRFYVVYALLLIPFTIVNGLLTGTLLAAPVVWYNSAEIIGFRLLTIPIEDIFYGMGLIMVNVSIYERVLHKLYQNAPSTCSTDHLPITINQNSSKNQPG